MDVEEWQSDWESVEACEIELPLEIWSIILSQRPMHLKDLASLQLCSRGMRSAVLDSGTAYFHHPPPPAPWPVAFVNELSEPRVLRVHSSQATQFSSHHIKDFCDRVVGLKQSMPTVVEHLFGSSPFHPNRDDTDDSEEDDEDGEDGGGEQFTEEYGDEYNEDSSDDMVVDVNQARAVGGELDHRHLEMQYDAERELWMGEEAYWDAFSSLTSQDNPKDNAAMELLRDLDCYQQAIAPWRMQVGIPSSITLLDLPYVQFPVELLPLALRTAILPFAAYREDLRPFPRSLTHLEVRSLKSAFGCPTKMKTLKIGQCQDLQTSFFGCLPHGLTSIDYDFCFKPADLSAMPDTITHMTLNSRYFHDDSSFYIPRHIRSLRLTNSRELTGQFFKKLPTQLLSFSFSGMTINDEDMALLPPHLTKLDFPSETPVTLRSFSLLPATLQERVSELPVVYFPVYAHMMLKRYPADWLEWEWPAWLSAHLPVQACSDLPRSMRELVVDGEHWTGDCLADLPPYLERLTLRKRAKMGPQDGSLLPRTLTELRLQSCTPSLDLIAALPASLVLLEVGGSWKHTIVTQPISFPPQLTSLSIGIPFGDEAYQSLPAGLQELHLYMSHLSNEQAQFLPRGLTSLRLPTDTLLTDAGIIHLPPGLLILDLQQNAHITDTGVMLLPRGLLALILPNNCGITDQGVPDLPRGLVQINMERNKNFTDLSFSSWPPDLVCAEFTVHGSVTAENPDSTQSSTTQSPVGMDPQDTLQAQPRTMSSPGGPDNSEG